MKRSRPNEDFDPNHPSEWQIKLLVAPGSLTKSTIMDLEKESYTTISSSAWPFPQREEHVMLISGRRHEDVKYALAEVVDMLLQQERHQGLQGTGIMSYTFIDSPLH